MDSGGLGSAGASILACNFFTDLIVLHSLQMLLIVKNSQLGLQNIIKYSSNLLPYCEVVNLRVFILPIYIAWVVGILQPNMTITKRRSLPKIYYIYIYIYYIYYKYIIYYVYILAQDND